MTTTLGVHQSDMILRSALVEMLEQIRKDPSLIDWIFSGLLADGLTAKEFGKRALLDAKDWFLKTKVNVYHGLAQAPPEFPAITMVLQESAETDKTLGDKHYDVDEPLGSYPVAVKSFAAVDYDPINSILTFPQDIADNVYLSTNMDVVDKVGKKHRITELLDDDRKVVIDGGPGDFREASLVYSFPYRIQLESVQCRETYQVGVHVQGPPVYLMVLHSIVVFGLWRYKQSLLEARNFAESSFSSSDFAKSPTMGQEAEYSRYISLSGTVKQFWPKDVTTPALGMIPGLAVIGGAHVPVDDLGRPQDLTWIGDVDSLPEKAGG